MAGGHVIGPDAVGIVEQAAELQPRIANDAGIGRSAGGVLGDEVSDDPVELLLEVDGVERDVELVGHAPGVGGVGGGAAALLAKRQAVAGTGFFRLLPVPHEQPDHFVALFAQEPRRHTAIDSAGHRQDNAGHGSGADDDG